MAQKTLFDNPKVTDIIEIDVGTPDSNGCYVENPYLVNSLIIYYVERSFSSTQFGEYDRSVVSDTLVQKLQIAQTTYCANPTQQNLINLQQMQAQVNSATITDTSYYSDAFPVLRIGSNDDPNSAAWLSDVAKVDLGLPDYEAPLVNIPTDSNGNLQFGQFQYLWTPNGSIRPGDFFMCWTWSPLSSGGTISQTMKFTIEGDPRSVITIPTHLTDTKKYPNLLERYLPEVYKGYLSDNDITPETLEMLNDAVAKGFTEVENYANQLIDLYDANALHESLLVYLSNLFNLKLKSNDPTLWRRQIKEAVPLFKQKGTKVGLGMAFSQSGMVLNSLKNLWQIVSPYTWQESFRVSSTLTWRLAHNIIQPIDTGNFELAIRRQGQSTYTVVPNNNVEFAPSECNLYTDMTWPGPNPPLPGDIIRVLYSYNAVLVSQQTNENYIRALPLADLRDEFSQLYPVKNWNVHVIQEDDPMFDVLVPVRHPFHELLVFGKVRTEFPYSENIYNMEEYNGSTRESLNPCDIDKDFVDPCGSCMSSKFVLDLGVQELSDDRIEEVYEIISENVPFHAFIHSINFSGEVVEYVPTPVEDIELLIDIRGNEYLLTGNANPIFTRAIDDGLTTWKVARDEAASSQQVASGSGTAYNSYVAFIAPLYDLDRIGIRPGSHALEIFAPSPNSGIYQIQPVEGSIAQLLTTITEPVNQSAFIYQLSNINYSTNVATITQMDLHVLYDTVDFASLGVQGEWDVANVPDYTGGIWKVIISSISYNIYTVLPDGGVVLDQVSATLPNSSTTVSYTLLDPTNTVVANSTTGTLNITKQALLNLNDSGITDLTQYVAMGDYVQYSGQDYLVCGISGGQIVITGYSSGNVGGATIAIRRRLIDRATGYLGYSGLELDTTDNYEVELGILNGNNPPPGDPTDNSLWKENFMFLIGNDYFKIAVIDGTHIVLDGAPYDWTTLASGGTPVNYEVYHFTKEPVSIDWVTLNQAPWSPTPQVGDGVDRSGRDPVIVEMLTQEETSVGALQLSPGAQIEEVVQVEEGVTFEVEWKDGRKTQGEII